MPPTSILALHGFTGRGSDWDLLRAALPGRTWNAPDLPGHGPAPELPADWPAHRRAIEKACAALPEKPVLLGYSMGGRLALHAALALPGAFSALVLTGASPGLETEAERAARRESDAALAVRILKSDTPAFLEAWDAQPLLAGRAAMQEPWRSRSLRARRENIPAGLAASLAGVGTGALPSLWERLGEITIPTLLIAGERDVKFKAIARRMAERMPGAALALIPEAGHAAHLENPAATARAIAAWETGLG